MQSNAMHLSRTLTYPMTFAQHVEEKLFITRGNTRRLNIPAIALRLKLHYELNSAPMKKYTHSPTARAFIHSINTY